MMILYKFPKKLTHTIFTMPALTSDATLVHFFFCMLTTNLDGLSNCRKISVAA